MYVQEQEQQLILHLNNQGIRTKAKTGTICGNAMVGMDSYEASIFSSRLPVRTTDDKLILDLANRLPKDNPMEVLRDVLQSFPKIGILSLSYNDLSQLPADLFQEQPYLEYLQIRRCNLSSLPDTIFQHLHNLIGVDLRSNHFKNLPNAIIKATDLVYLNISHNPISVTYSEVAELSSLQSLKMRDTNTPEEEVEKILAINRLSNSNFKVRTV